MMMTVSDMREAWTYALTEIDSAIAYLENKKGVVGGAPRQAAEGWLVILYRDRTEAADVKKSANPVKINVDDQTAGGSGENRASARSTHAPLPPHDDVRRG